MNSKLNFIEELHWRGLISDHTPNVEKLFDSDNITAYIGFDPTSKSLHVGSLLPIMALVRLQKAGHQPIAVIGGGTGLIGDPSGKEKERSILTRTEISKNLRSIRSQLSNFLDFSDKISNSALIINNAEWLSQVNLVDFLRDTGKHFTVNYMLRLESIRSRISRDTGISFTEFSYMTLQAFDYLNLYEKYGCKLQMGGSDQWGNIIAGVDLINKNNPGKTTSLAHGIVFPLITSRTGEKFGKSEGTAPTLDEKQTSPYKLYQFFFNIDDRDVIQYMKYFTLLSKTEINNYQQSLKETPKKRESQIKLAEEITRMIHSDKGLYQARKITNALFEGTLTKLKIEELKDALEWAPSSKIKQEKLTSAYTVEELCVEQGICTSLSETRRLISQGGLYINELRVLDPKENLSQIHTMKGKLLVVKKGSKYFHLVEIE